MCVVDEMNGAVPSLFEVAGGRAATFGLANIVHRRNQITAEFLAYLAELDERQLFLDLGFYPFGYHEARSSLFEYCLKTLNLCESTADRHVAAAGVPQASSGVRVGGKRFVARFVAEFAEEAPNTGERGGVV